MLSGVQAHAQVKKKLAPVLHFNYRLCYYLGFMRRWANSEPRFEPRYSRPVRVADAEAHGRGPGRHAELPQQGDEARIVRLVVDDEARVDGVVDAVDLDVDGVGVPAGAGGGFEDREVVVGLQTVCGHQTRDPGSHDRHLHSGGTAPTPHADGAVTWVTTNRSIDRGAGAR